MLVSSIKQDSDHQESSQFNTMIVIDLIEAVYLFAWLYLCETYSVSELIWFGLFICLLGLSVCEMQTELLSHHQITIGSIK